MSTQNRWQDGEFEWHRISSKWYTLHYIGTANRAITMTGSDVTKDFNLPFTAVIKRVHGHHTTSTITTDATGEVTLKLRRDAGNIPHVPHMKSNEYTKTAIGDSVFIVSFEDLGDEGGFVLEKGSIVTLVLNATNTDLIQIKIYVKRLD